MKNEKSSTVQKALSIKAQPQKRGVSVVVPCEPGGDPSACLQALKSLPKAEKSLILEVFVVWGRHPSRQRNQAALQARGAWLLFLDADSRLSPGSLPALLDSARRFGAVAVGGPNLPPADESPLGLAFDRVLGSWAGSGASRARYASVGLARVCGEKELILCNVLMRREAFAHAGGFREDLYPNEENELFNRLRAAGLRLVYEPQATVRRPRRQSVWDFTLQAFRYGRGRTQQMRRNAYWSDAVNLAPAALQLSLLGTKLLGFRQPLYWLWPCAYALACALSQGFSLPRGFYLILRHQAYAFGLWAGLIQTAAARPQALRIQRIQLGAPRA